MAMSEFTKDMNIIQKLDDEPNDRDGLTAAELKAKFDEGGLAVKDYLNNTVKPFADGLEAGEAAHEADTDNPHSVTKAQVGLGNVPNVATNDQTPTYSEASTLTTLTSGEKLSVAFGKLKKAVSSLISHLADTVVHITAAERTTWNSKANGSHTHAAGDINSGTLAAARLPAATSSTQGAVTLGASGGAAAYSHTHDVEDVPDLLDAVRYGPAEAVTIQDAGGGLPVKSCVVNIQPVQIGYGDPSPSNIRPIFGWTGARVSQAQANLWTGEQMLEDIKLALPDASVSGSQINIVASSTRNKRPFLSAGFKENTQYTLILRYTNTSVSGAEGYCRPNVAIFYTDGTFTDLIGQGFTANTFKTVAFRSNANKTISYIAGCNNNATSTIDTAASGLFEGYLTVDDFEAFSGEIIDYSFPIDPLDFRTMYGGTLDVLTGVLTMDKRGMTFSGTESWTSAGSGSNMLFRYIDSRGKARGAERASSHLPNATITTDSAVIGYYVYTSGSRSDTFVQFRPGLASVTDTTTWKAWLAAQAQAGTPLTCWWTMQTPVVYQLTPKEVLATLAGTNNFWCNAGQVSVEFGAFLRMLQSELDSVGGRIYISAGQKLGTTLGDNATAEGFETTSSGDSSHAEGGQTEATGHYSHAEGYITEANGISSHAEGSASAANGQRSHAEGQYTIADGDNQHVFGKYNISNTTDVEIVGWGTSSTRKNIRTLASNGNMTIAGTLTQSSDARLKDVQGEIPDVSGIRAVRFKWNDVNGEHDDKEHIGYIAQEVERIAPFLVGDDSNGYKSLDYIALLCAKVECLERRVAELTEALHRQ